MLDGDDISSLENFSVLADTSNLFRKNYEKVFFTYRYGLQLNAASEGTPFDEL